MKKITAKFRQYLKDRHVPEKDIMAPLAGIHELRNCVEWANAEREDSHDFCTPQEILERYRAWCVEEEITSC